MTSTAPTTFTVRTCSNVALVKYWGKSRTSGNLPATGSISIGLDNLTTETHLSVVDAEQDRILIDGKDNGQGVNRVREFFELSRRHFCHNCYFKVESNNNFPTRAGLASSASGFAALALAINGVLHLGLSHRSLSQFARMGSGSAARSIFGGYVEMHVTDDAYARQIAEADYWPLSVIVAITSTAEKPIGSTEAMQLTASTSAYYPSWIESHAKDISCARESILNRDFETLANVSELSCLKMHGMMMASSPPILYWNSATIDVIHKIQALRDTGLSAFFTIDAGPQVKVICLPGLESAIESELKKLPGVITTIRTHVGGEPVVLEES